VKGVCLNERKGRVAEGGLERGKETVIALIKAGGRGGRGKSFPAE